MEELYITIIKSILDRKNIKLLAMDIVQLLNAVANA